MWCPCRSIWPATGAIACAVALVVGSGACRAGAEGPVEIRLGADGDRTVVEVVNLPGELTRVLRDAELPRERWADVLRVSVADGEPAMVGEYAVRDAAVRFSPMFPLDPGRPYHVVFNPAAVPWSRSAEAAPVVTTLTLPAVRRDPSTVVSHVFPSGDSLPENQLRLYIHFSAPMGRAGGLDHITLVDANGTEVVDPFLPLDAEFWNDDRTRYTVFFDPGRQKRGILPNTQMGRSLEPGRRYTLVVRQDWRDGNGLPLREEFRREFTVAPADERPIDVSGWRISVPHAGTTEAVVVTFDEPLDHGLLLRALGVTQDGVFLTGDVTIGASETRWSFRPRDAWRLATYHLTALAMLEDRAGNRIGRAFEVDQFDRTDASAEPERTSIPFTVR